MSTARTKQRTASGLGAAVATSGIETWGFPAAAGAIALGAAVASAFELVSAPVGLAVTVFGVLVLAAERGLAKAAAAETPGVAIAFGLGLVWVAICYAPFHLLFFPGTALHAPIMLHAADPSLPVAIPTSGRHAVDLMLEGQLPPNPGGGTALPVQYAITFEDGTGAPQTLSGRFEENLRTRRLGRRGTATVVQAHHAERRLLQNPAGGDVRITAVSLEPAAGASVTVTAFAHRLPSTPLLVLLTLAILAGVVAVDARLVPRSDGTLTFATPAALGAALALWTSNTVHPTVSSLIGSLIFGGPVGLGVGALLWAIARRTLVVDRR